MAAIQIDVIYTRYSGGLWGRNTTTVYPIVTESDRLHEIIRESIPELRLQLEDESGRFLASEITLTARNDDSWWNPGGTGAFSYPDPFMIYGSEPYKKPHTVKVYRDGILRFEGDIDLTTVTYDRKARTVTFTVVGALARLAQYTAETVRRSFPVYLDTGAASAVGTGTLTDSTKTWVVNRYANHVLVDGLGTIWRILSNTATVLTVSTPWPTGATVPSTGTYCIHPFGFMTRDDFGTSTAVGANSLTDATRTWTVNQWAGFYCEDSAGAIWPIASNTATVLTLTAGGATPASGAYSIIYGNARRVFKSRGPSVVSLGLRAGDKLLVTGALQAYSYDSSAGSGGFWRNRGQWEAQEVEIEFTPNDGGTASGVGALTITDSTKSWTVNAWAGYWACYLSGGAYVTAQIASNTATQLTLVALSPAPTASTPYTVLLFRYPSLRQDEVWLKEDYDAHLLPRDCTVCTTPYYRDLSVETLVRLLYAQAQITNAKVLIPTTLASLTVPYADFTGKSVADALGELAAVTGCAMFCQYVGTETLFFFRRRDEGVGYMKTATDALCTREDRLLWERFYDGVVARGAEDRVVVRGSQRYGGRQLEVGSDMISTYSWLRQLADRAWSFYALQRQSSEVSVLGEFTGQQLYSFENDPVGYFPPGWTVGSGVASAWIVDEPYALTSRVLLGETLTGSVHSAVRCDAIGSVTDVDMQVDIYMDQQNYRFGLFLRQSLSSAYAVYLIPFVAGSLIGIYQTTWSGDTQLACSTAKTVAQKTWYTLRVQAQGAVIRAKFWTTGSAEPTSWDVTYSSASVFTGYVGLVADKTRSKGYFDNFAWVGGQWNIGDFVSLDGSDSWIVVGITEPLEHYTPTVKLSLISYTGTSYTPSDDQTDDPDALPEPPSIAYITIAGGVRYIVLDWAYDISKVAGFLYCPWTQTNPRPESTVYFAQAGNTATYLGGGQWQIMASTVTWGSSPWFVDVAVVLADGRISKASVPVVTT